MVKNILSPPLYVVYKNPVRGRQKKKSNTDSPAPRPTEDDGTAGADERLSSTRSERKNRNNTHGVCSPLPSPHSSARARDLHFRPSHTRYLYYYYHHNVLQYRNVFVIGFCNRSLVKCDDLGEFIETLPTFY